MTTPPDQATFAFVGAFVDELARAGVRHVCIAPGSRSTPLALSIAAQPDLRTWMHLDERSASFFALGMARALGEPVALLCTSGTATANFLPAVVEAHSACVPLIILTADRPPELRDVGAAQTIDQNRLYGAHAKWFVEVALADITPDLMRYARTLACRAVATAAEGPAGPVHLNFPFREPLIPSAVAAPAGMLASDALAWHGRPDGAPWVTVTHDVSIAGETTILRIAAVLRAARRPLLICGPQYNGQLAAPLAALAEALPAPLLADPLSQIRWGPHRGENVIDRYDAALRDEAVAHSLAPDVVLRIGAIPTSKALLQYLQRHASAHQIVVDASGWPDPTLAAADVVHADPERVCAQLGEAIRGQRGGSPSVPSAQLGDSTSSDRSAWLAQWQRMDRETGSALTKYSATLDEPFEGAALTAIAGLMPPQSTLFVSSSMPVRDLDAFAAGDSRPLRVLANRGANGIDGVVSSALGVAAARKVNGAPVVLVIGDIAFYHDMNGLLAARLHALDATIVILNNDGGGIFSFLPQAAQSAHFEQLFGTPHGLRFEATAALYGARYHAVATLDAMRNAVTAGVTGTGLHIVELHTDRARNVTLHREAWAQVAHEMSVAPGVGAPRNAADTL
ncbi:MAG: 2-succinyl-5-enolpyruvyl-6-hydroxy-3-cyclohexene-1-carboxylic-acid synthase [Gemmatimonadaceae bacterium]